MWTFLVALSFGAGHGSEARQARDLGDAATKYWEGVRWNDPGKSTPYLADLEARVALTQLINDPQVRLTDATVVQVELGVETKGDPVRPAVVLIRLEIVDQARNRYETLNYVQHWSEIGRAWVINSAKSPLAADRPWTTGAAAPETVVVPGVETPAAQVQSEP